MSLVVALVGLICSRKRTEEGLSGNAEEERPLTDDDSIGMTEQFKIVFESFSEADAWVGDNSVTCDSRFFQRIQAGRKKIADVGNHVVVMRIGLHGLWSAQNMHADHAAVRLDTDVDDFWFEG